MPGRVGENPEPNRGCLYKLVVSNFKSYAGTLTIGPFKDFTCVIGPNGSGKSNLMDAVSFVVGVNTTQLRGAKLADFRSHNLSSATDEPTSVTLYYHSPSSDGDAPEEVQFTRTITVSRPFTAPA
jgi:structural maintenance of chromosome 1